MPDRPDPELPRIPYLRLRATLRAEEPARLPPYTGSMLRGAFGHALRRLVCVMGPAQPCLTCALRRACVHTRLFETFFEDEPPPPLEGLVAAARPYVFEPLGAGGTLDAGETFAFDLILLGQAAELQGYALLALARMARRGLGAGRARFALDRVEAVDGAGGARTLLVEDRLVTGAPAAPILPARDGLPAGPLALRLATPLRLKVRGRLVVQPGVRDLVLAMLRRTLELAYVHLPGAQLDWDLRLWLERADDVRVVRQDLRWHDWERYSHRQGTRMKLGGVIGDIVLEGHLAPFAGLLRTAEIVHVGKSASFGLGKVELAPAVG